MSRHLPTNSIWKRIIIRALLVTTYESSQGHLSLDTRSNHDSPQRRLGEGDTLAADGDACGVQEKRACEAGRPSTPISTRLVARAVRSASGSPSDPAAAAEMVGDGPGSRGVLWHFCGLVCTQPSTAY